MNDPKEKNQDEVANEGTGEVDVAPAHLEEVRTSKLGGETSTDDGDDEDDDDEE